MISSSLTPKPNPLTAQFLPRSINSVRRLPGMLHHAHAETVAERSEAKVRREAKLLPKFSRHFVSPTKITLRRTDPAALALLHSLRTGNRPLPHPPRNKKIVDPPFGIVRRRRAVTALGFRKDGTTASRRSKIVFSSDDEGIFAAGSVLASNMRESQPILTQTHQTTLQFLGTNVPELDVCRALSSGTCSALHTLRLDSCPIGLRSVGNILKASHYCTKLTRISMNTLNGSKGCPLTPPAERVQAGKAIALALISHPSLVFASLRNNGLGQSFSNTLRTLVIERKGSLVLPVAAEAASASARGRCVQGPGEHPARLRRRLRKIRREHG